MGVSAPWETSSGCRIQTVRVAKGLGESVAKESEFEKDLRRILKEQADADEKARKEEQEQQLRDMADGKDK